MSLSLGDSAWVPASTALRAPYQQGLALEIETNLASSVHAIAGIWDSDRGMLLVANFAQPDVHLTRGDVIGVARPTYGEEPAEEAAPPAVAAASAYAASTSPPEINHVQRKEEELQKLHEVDLPPESYYVNLEEWRKKKFPDADPHVLEHCASLEPFLDICIASGFSLGAAKSTGKIFQAEIEFLGDIVGREGLRSTEKHLDAVKHFGEVNDIEAMRRFLGAFGWVRKSYPKEVIVILPTLTAQLRKDALWPMPDAAQKAKLALQSLAIRAVLLATVVEIAAITRDRPLEQVADGCRYGWGGTVYQVSPCRRFINVVGSYSGLLTAAQSQAHPRRIEVLAQRETRRASRKHIGRLPADWWSGHAHLITDLKAPEADSSVIRWIADIESDGSRIRNLAGRAAHLGDGLSRQDEAHSTALREASKSLRSASIEDFLDDMEDDGPQPYGAGSHVLPFPEEQRTSPFTTEPARTTVRSVDPSSYAAAAKSRAERITALKRNPTSFPAEKADVPAALADVAAVASSDAIVTLFLPSAASAARRELSLAALRNEFEVTFPTLRFVFVAHHPPMFDGVCDEVYFVPPTDYRPEAKIRKMLKQELLSATTSVFA